MVLIGIDPHKATHTAVAVDTEETALGELTVKADRHQVERLLKWAIDFPERRWAVESANGLGFLLAQQLVAAGEDVVDVPPTLAARVRVLGSGKTQKNDPNDALSTAIAALRAKRLRTVWVPKIPSTSRDLAILVNEATKPVGSHDPPDRTFRSLFDRR